ncbi:hypothetical protein, partial [Streptomyces sp. O3]
IYSDEKSRVLVDKTKSGKVRPWREKKIANVDYFELLHILEFKKAERCVEVLVCMCFKVLKTLKIGCTEKPHLLKL